MSLFMIEDRAKQSAEMGLIKFNPYRFKSPEYDAYERGYSSSRNSQPSV